MKGHQRSEPRPCEIFRLGERIDGDQFALAQNAGRLDVFVDEPFDGKDELIVKRRHGLSGKPPT